MIVVGKGLEELGQNVDRGKIPETPTFTECMSWNSAVMIVDEQRGVAVDPRR